MEMEMQRRKVDWTELPKELLEKIAYKVHSRIELQTFRAVCRKWRSSYPSPVSTSLLYPPFPYKIPTFSSIFNESDRPVFVVGSAVYLIHPLHQHSKSKSWIISVEELKPGKLRLRYPFSRDPIEEDLPKNFPNPLDMAGFRATQIGEGLRLCSANGDEDVFSFEGFWPCNEYPTKTKMIMFNDDDPETPTRWSYMVLLLDQGGSLGTLKSNGKWKFINYGPGFHFDDIVKYRGKVCAIDREGRAYLIDGSESRVIERISEGVYTGDDSPSRKLLVRYYDNVMMVVRGHNKFWLYMLNEEEHCWDEVNNLQKWILFVTFDGCFFVSSRKIPGCRGNCIMFPNKCFAFYSEDFYGDDEVFEGASKYHDVGLYYLDEDCCRVITSEPGLSNAFWPPPSWLGSDSESFTWVSEEDEVMDSSSYSGSESSEEVVSPDSLQHVEDAPTSQNHSSSCSQKETLREGGNNNISAPAINSPCQFPQNAASMKKHQRNDVNFFLVTHNTSQKPIVVESVPTTSSMEVPENVASPIEVSSDLLPILQKIWDKHGNIIEGHVIKSDALLTWALESLAKMIVILQSNTGTSLKKSQAEYLNSTLGDLQLMHFRLDWLVPFVEKALALQKSKEQIDNIVELEITRSKLVAELHVLDERLAEQKKLVAESLMVSAPLVLEMCLGEGLC